ncbi:hypothetical protein DSM104299_02815 [Baekduia alba]|uniref:hypothetical protein n=1 Tax=Baekduia alba TaxID=2997333 RepID=UPI0023404E0D|nr:hypothetical protein [Baekduia alba]WCB94087.1 hypothetical protein DSM104299_02815 [Baekduia alba]
MRMRSTTLVTTAATVAALLLSASGAIAADAPTGAPQDLASTGADRTLTGTGPGAQTGWAVAAAGDVNGDGIADAIVGAPGGPKDPGTAYVVFGSPGASPLTALATLGDGGFKITGGAPGDRAGLAVSAAGDVNGDGLADVVVGAPGAAAYGRADAGVAYVVYGKKTPEAVALGQLGAGGYAIVGAAPGDGAGTALAALGDEGRDGVPDLAVGAPGSAALRKRGGAAYVVAGHRGGGDVDLADPASGPSWRMDGPTGGFAGLALAAVGDLNGDGASEIAVGAPGTDPAAIDDGDLADVADGHEARGAAYVVYGHGGTSGEDLPRLAADHGVRLRAGTTDQALGLALAAGDLDGDGVADLAIGVPLSDRNDRQNSGSAYVLYGARGLGGTLDLSAPDAARVLRLDGAAAKDAFGAGVALPGDLDADGKPDLVISAVFASPFDRADAGAAYRVSGAPVSGTLDAGKLPVAQTFAGSTAGGHLRALAAAGDLDRDGATDLLLGEPEAGDGGTVRIVRGIAPALVTPAPTAPDPGVQEEVDQDGCHAATRFELLIDDSGSMEDSDPDRLRAKALELLLAKPGNAGRTFTAVQFGSEASNVFDATKIAYGVAGVTQIRDLSAALERDLVADDGGTNYNAGFRSLNRAAGRASARIFLTDGEHNEGGDFRNGHRGGPPTYVIGLGPDLGGRRSEAGQRLGRIARETKGTFFPNVTVDTVQAVMNAIAAKVNCDIEFDQYVDTLTAKDPEADTNVTDLESGTASADVDVTWGDPDDDVQPSGLVVVDGGKPVVALPQAALAQAASGQTVTVGKVKVSGRRGLTYVSLHVTGLKGADRLRVRVKAAAVRGRDGVRVRTQVAQSRRRR